MQAVVDINTLLVERVAARCSNLDILFCSKCGLEAVLTLCQHQSRI